MAHDDREHEQALALKLWVVLARAHGAVSEHAKADIASHDLTAGEFAVLEVLLHRGPLLLGEIQRKILVSSGGITYLIDRLEKVGLVERQQCPKDRRACYAALTPAGEERIRQIFPEHARCIEQVLSGLDTGEKEQAVALLRKLGRAAAELPPCGAAEQ